MKKSEVPQHFSGVILPEAVYEETFKSTGLSVVPFTFIKNGVVLGGLSFSTNEKFFKALKVYTLKKAPVIAMQKIVTEKEVVVYTFELIFEHGLVFYFHLNPCHALTLEFFKRNTVADAMAFQFFNPKTGEFPLVFISLDQTLREWFIKQYLANISLAKNAGYSTTSKKLAMEYGVKNKKAVFFSYNAVDRNDLYIDQADEVSINAM